MKQTVKEMLDSRAEEYDIIEYYTWNNERRTIHTDNVDAIDDSSVKDWWLVERDDVMDEEDYNESICANTGLKYADQFDEGTRVLVVVVKPRVKVFVSSPAPRYAIGSISKVAGALCACSGVFADEERISNGPYNGCIRLYFDNTEDVKKAIAYAVDYLNEDFSEEEKESSGAAHTNSDYTSISYDAATAEIQED